MTYTTKLLLALHLLLPLTACDLDALPTSDRAALTANEDAARPDHRPPPLVLLELAIDRGDLTTDAAMTEALDAMEAAHAAALASGDALALALADAVSTDGLTADAFATQLAAITLAARGEADALTVALDTAHAQLDADLRAEVVDALPEPPPRPEAGQGPPRAEPGGPIALLEALELDDTQKQALRDALGEPPRPERPEPLDLEQFAEDDFSATSLGLADLHARHMTDRATHQVELLVALVPLLDDDQRATLEALLRDTSRGPTRAARG